MCAFGNAQGWIGSGLGETVLPAETSVEEWRAWLKGWWYRERFKVCLGHGS
jgi:hypothetical protein